MSPEPVTPKAATNWHRLARVGALKVAQLLLAGLLLGFAYNWAAPVLYRPGADPGFWQGCAHGALMPVALPALLVGKDVPIYAPKNQGRLYKLGYIAGINACGFIFFGLAFWQPKPRPPNRSEQSQT